MSNEAKIEAYEKAQQELIDSFKLKINKAAEEVIGKMYCDVTKYADTDAHTNYHNYLKEVFRDSIIKEVALSDYGHYSWAHDIRIALMEKYPEQIRNKIIDDLQDKIKSLEDHIEQMRKSRYGY